MIRTLPSLFNFSKSSHYLGQKLSTSDHTVNFSLVKKNGGEETYQLEVFDRKTQTRIKASISSIAGHVDFSFSSELPSFFLEDGVVNEILVLENKYGVVLAPIIFTKERAGTVDGGEVVFHKAGYLALKEFLKAGTLPDISLSDGRTWLYRAVENGDREKVALLLQYGANNTALKGLKTPLAQAAQMGFIEAVKMMHDTGFEDSSINIQALLSEDEALKDKNYEIINNLLASSSPMVAAKDQDGNTALQYALLQGDQQAVTMLLTKPCAPVLVQEKDSQGRTPLLMLLDPSYKDWGLDSVKSIVQAFIDKGADLTVQDTQGNGVLHYALKWNDVDLVEMLLKAGATAVINIPNNDQETALEVAGFSALEDLLLKYGADPRMKVSHARRSLLESVKKDPDTFEKFTTAVQELEKKGIPDPMAQ